MMRDYHIFWLWFTGIFLTAISLTSIMDSIFESDIKTKELRTIKIEACKSLQEEAARALCIRES